MTVSKELVTWVRKQQENIPDDYIQKAIQLVKDSIAVSVAASRISPVADMSYRVVQNNFGNSMVWGKSDGLNPESAVFVNTALAHALDFDDTHDKARLHTTTVLLSPALASAQIQNCSGQKLLESFVIASEVMCRLGVLAEPKGTGQSSHWFLTQLLGTIAAALITALMLDLDDEQIESALGIALSVAAGSKQAAIGSGSNLRSIYPAFAAKSGFEAAVLAKHGILGPIEAFEGRAGYWGAFLGKTWTDGDTDKLVRQDSDWEFSQIAIKPWPACRMAHPYIDAVLSQYESIEKPDEISQIVLEVNDSALRLCVPRESRTKPETMADGLFSIPFMIAVALVKGEVGLKTLGEDLLSDQQILNMAEKVVVNLSLPDSTGNPPGKVKLIMAEQELYLSGSPSPRMSLEGQSAKSRSCYEIAGYGQSSELIEELIDQFPSATVIESLHEITKLLGMDL